MVIGVHSTVVLYFAQFNYPPIRKRRETTSSLFHFNLFQFISFDVHAQDMSSGIELKQNNNIIVLMNVINIFFARRLYYTQSTDYIMRIHQ